MWKFSTLIIYLFPKSRDVNIWYEIRTVSSCVSLISVAKFKMFIPSTCIIYSDAKIQKNSNSRYLFHLRISFIQCKVSKASLSYFSSTLLHSDTKLLLIRVKKEKIISSSASLTHIFIILKISLYQQWPCYRGLYLSLCLRADAFTHWICFQNYQAELKIKVAFELFIAPTLVEGRDNRDRKSPGVIYIPVRFEVLKFGLKSNKRAGEKMNWRQREGMLWDL